MKRARRAVSQRAPDLENLAPRDDCARCSAGATASVGTNVRKPSTKTGPSRCGTKKRHLDGTNLAAMRRKALWRGGRAVECGGLERREEPYRLVPIRPDEARFVRASRPSRVGSSRRIPSGPAWSV